jgi:predicted AlkP superfamily pyrophosphatase or phosphodiesterase
MLLFTLLDGLRPDALSAERTPAIWALKNRGASCLTARSVMPCITLPCHTSIFHSVPPERHGITTNNWTPMARPLPGLFDVAKAAGKRCGFFYNWEPLRNVSVPGSLAYSLMIDNVETADGDHILAAEAARVLISQSFDFAFVYLGTTDTAGHAYGWMSDGYLAQVAAVDAVVARLLAELPLDTHVLLQSDHGGHDRTHGTPAPEDMTIPWLLAGPDIKPGYTITGPVSLLDTAPTLARLLGISPHHQWEGHSIDEAFKDKA